MDKILLGIGALVFMFLMALNVQLVNSSNGIDDGFSSLSLTELAAKAQCDPQEDPGCTGGGGGCESKPADFDCDSGGQGAISCKLSETLFGVYTITCEVTCEGDGCYACCDRYLDECKCYELS